MSSRPRAPSLFKTAAVVEGGRYSPPVANFIDCDRSIRALIFRCIRPDAPVRVGWRAAPSQSVSRTSLIIMRPSEPPSSCCFECEGIEVRRHASANTSLRVAAPDVDSCLIIGVEIPGIGGLERSLIRPTRRPEIQGSQAGFRRHYLCFSFINGAKEFSGEGAR